MFKLPSCSLVVQSGCFVFQIISVHQLANLFQQDVRVVLKSMDVVTIGLQECHMRPSKPQSLTYKRMQPKSNPWFRGWWDLWWEKTNDRELENSGWRDMAVTWLKLDKFISFFQCNSIDLQVTSPPLKIQAFHIDEVLFWLLLHQGVYDRASSPRWTSLGILSPPALSGVGT